jgi:hypothetical protein
MSNSVVIFEVASDASRHRVVDSRMRDAIPLAKPALAIGAETPDGNTPPTNSVPWRFMLLARWASIVFVMSVGLCVTAAAAIAQTAHEMLATFGISTIGRNSATRVIQGTDGNLYGTTEAGVENAFETIFTLDLLTDSVTNDRVPNWNQSNVAGAEISNLLSTTNVESTTERSLR